ncbi:VIT1/CCC1 family predicted Fe2+/Mn2+ transporter [Sulfuritortus calidifontis]|uniref:VIT1/CCC1 family predicted Fe2+/Mn2+ transporter n=1 Tax=Sulfuritortus calidifontis TaxID=1914471 RepID=A0A4R3JVU0_9PROT|nr:VIT1/CCC1 transporter family protein [Sulfuritortus calidifontis]TCS72146.1 VIT1/CCC1 family predicted Fe2+/Mn2+ transporter [Sulfuritortus calidifontis]
MLDALNSWKEEKRSAWLYRIVSDAEAGTPRQVLFLELARAADEQADLWAVALRKAGQAVPETFVPGLRSRAVAWLVGRVGVAPMRGVLAAMKVRGMSLYNAPLPHAIPTRTDQIDTGRHKAPGSGGLRAAVFGVNDGLVSNASLILGVAGAGAEPSVIVLSGVAGLLAGAFSMAAGEYVSVRAQREFYEYQIALEREELDQYPQEEAAELALIYEAKGVAPDEAKRVAAALIRDPDQALDTLAREELGLNPAELGSPWVAATASFLAFSGGALIPLLPYLLLSVDTAFAGTLIATGVSLFGVGATISLFTGKRAAYGGLRMLTIGAAAGAATWLIGKGLGVALG